MSQFIYITSFARTLVDDADAATMRTTLGLGTLATQNSVSSVDVVDAAGVPCYVAMLNAATGNLQPLTDAGLTYNASTNVLTAGGITVNGATISNVSQTIYTAGSGKALVLKYTSGTDSLLELRDSSDTVLLKSSISGSQGQFFVGTSVDDLVTGSPFVMKNISTSDAVKDFTGLFYKNSTNKAGIILSQTNSNSYINSTWASAANVNLVLGGINSAGTYRQTLTLDSDDSAAFSSKLSVATSVTTPIIKPSADSTSSFSIANAAGTGQFVFDTTNGRLAAGPTSGAPNATIHFRGVANHLQFSGASNSYGLIFSHDGSGYTHMIDNYNSLKYASFGEGLTVPNIMFFPGNDGYMNLGVLDYGYYARIFATGRNASGKVFVAQGAASRTAPLIQLQTSANGSLGNVSGGCFGDVYADVSTTHTDGTFDTLRTDTFVANARIANGDKIYFDYTLKTVSHAANTVNFKLAFGGITIWDSGALTFGANAGTVQVTGYITRATSTTCRATIEFLPSGSSTILAFQTITYASESTLTGMTLTGTNNLVLSAASASTGAASGDITLVQATCGVIGFGS